MIDFKQVFKVNVKNKNTLHNYCRCKVWITNCRRSDLDKLRKQTLYLYESCRLCADHFEDTQFMNPRLRNRLTSTAVPTIFKVPNPPLPLKSIRKSPRKRLFVKQEDADFYSLQKKNDDDNILLEVTGQFSFVD